MKLKKTSSFLLNCLKLVKRSFLFIFIIIFSFSAFFSTKVFAYTNDYPYQNATPGSIDDWKFEVRNCTSYVAWRLNRDYGTPTSSSGYYFYNYMKGPNGVSGQWGNAGNWAANAQLIGFPVDTTPRAGDVAWTSGHVAYVESVNQDGSVNISEYNGLKSLQWSTRSNYRATKYIHINSIDGTVFAAMKTNDGRMFYFSKQNSKLMYKYETYANGGWSNWIQLADDLSGDPAVGRNADGRLEVFYRGANSLLMSVYQNSSGVWSQPGTFSGARIAGNPVVGSNQDGRLEVFARALDNKMFRIWQTYPNGGWNSGVTMGNGDLKSDPAVGQNADGRLEVMAISQSGRAVGFYQNAVNNSNTWSGQGYYGSTGGLVSNPVFIRHIDGRLEAFVRNNNNQLLHIWEQFPNGGWWSTWDFFAQDVAGNPAGYVNSNGTAEVFVRGTDNRLKSRWWDKGQWFPLGTNPLTYTIVGSPVVMANADDRLEVFAKNSHSTVVHVWQQWAFGGWSTGSTF